MTDYRDVETSSSIKSYGLIVFVREPTIRFLLIQKRETYEYMTFMKGIWRTQSDLNYLFSKMTKDERCRLRDYTFDELWDDLFISKTYSYYTTGFSRSNARFRSIRHSIPKILDAIPTDATHLPWEFPKGKKCIGESYVDCALREFREETGLLTDFLKVNVDVVPIGEMFVGGDNKMYGTIYHIAEASSALQPQVFDTPNAIRKTTVSSEAIDVRWMTIDELTPLISRSRRVIIKKVTRLIRDNHL